MNRLLLFILLIVYLNFINVFANEIEERSIDIEDVKKLGLYQPLKELPENMIQKINSNCNHIECYAKKAGSEVYYRFVKKKKNMNKYPGKMMFAMAWYEILYHSNLKKNDIFIKRFLLNDGDDYKNKKIDEMKIRSLISMNQGRENMRKSLGMNLDVSVEEAIENFWVMGEFLDQGSPKKIKVEKTLLARKEVIKNYKARIYSILNKIKESEKSKKD